MTIAFGGIDDHGRYRERRPGEMIGAFRDVFGGCRDMKIY